MSTTLLELALSWFRSPMVSDTDTQLPSGTQRYCITIISSSSVRRFEVFHGRAYSPERLLLHPSRWVPPRFHLEFLSVSFVVTWIPARVHLASNKLSYTGKISLCIRVSVTGRRGDFKTSWFWVGTERNTRTTATE